MDNVTQRFLLCPTDTARAQEIFYRLSRSAVACAMVELVELAREKLIWRMAERAVFQSDHRSKRQIDLERRAQELEAQGRKFWRLGLDNKARWQWRRADKLWAKIDEIALTSRIRMQAMDKTGKAPSGRQEAA